MTRHEHIILVQRLRRTAPFEYFDQYCTIIDKLLRQTDFQYNLNQAGLEEAELKRRQP